MKIVSKFLLTFLLTGTYICVFAQNDSLTRSKPKVERRKNSFNLDFPMDKRLGYPYWGINYERILVNQPHWFVTGRIGLEVLGTSNAFTCNLGRKRHYVELGFGQHIGWNPFAGFHKAVRSGYIVFDNQYFIHPILGYRFQPLKKGLTASIYLRPTRVESSKYSGSPMSGQTYTYSKVIHSWFAFKIGYCF